MKKLTIPSVPSPKRPPPASRTYSIHEVAQLSGLTDSLLRAWEFRYGWPNPHRNVNNQYRMYRQWDVENAKRIAEYLAAGWLISQLLKDGHPTWPKEGEVPSPIQKAKRISRKLLAARTMPEATEQPTDTEAKP